MELSTAITCAQKIAAGSATSEEERAFHAWMNDAPAEEYRQIADAYYLALGDAGIHTGQHPELLNKMELLLNRQPAVHRIPLLQTQWFRYAAILLLVAATATYLYTGTPSFRTNPEVRGRDQAPVLSDIPPGGNKATLTLSDGSTIILDSAATGSLANESGTNVTKHGAGMLVYMAPRDPKGMTEGGKTTYNTITTPKGGQFRITLPDGTKVWLNAASGIRFPVVFGDSRVVEITGESYLEVAPDKSKPFYVKTDQSTIQVLGTSFNVNAYANEPSPKTSLLEGSIRIGDVTLKPGQAYLDGRVITANMEQDLAWKNGAFNFEHADFKEAMRQLERWYDIEVVYEKGVPDIQLGGEISRNVPLKDVLKGLSGARVHFRMENEKKLIIMP